ncbi:hypothetical protein K504DRAFT_16767 [Pleomassaria siparia CBS 279.74]|uniref:Uncharacterized protein n=1 Tax=Pleomassaria siparia CBS 279.74 TaxID=1314801 RepID=A0A6G1KQ83_9PLEO|nr:hypothetical protein K504DRAFT_16767 [Pleomassaria siparia CBS 279.74]
MSKSIVRCNYPTHRLHPKGFVVASERDFLTPSPSPPILKPSNVCIPTVNVLSVPIETLEPPAPKPVDTRQVSTGVRTPKKTPIRQQFELYMCPKNKGSKKGEGRTSCWRRTRDGK